MTQVDIETPQAAAPAASPTPTDTVVSHGWWILIDHASDEGRDHAYGPFLTSEAAGRFADESPRMEWYRRIAGTSLQWWRLDVTDQPMTHEDIEALGYQIHRHGFLFPWDPARTWPEPPAAFEPPKGKQLDAEWWRTGTAQWVPVPPPTPCRECQRVGGHKATCPAVEPACTCQLADCRDCMRRPGVRITHTDRSHRILPANHRTGYPI